MIAFAALAIAAGTAIHIRNMEEDDVRREKTAEKH